MSKFGKAKMWATGESWKMPIAVVRKNIQQCKVIELNKKGDVRWQKASAFMRSFITFLNCSKTSPSNHASTVLCTCNAAISRGP